MFSPIIRIQGNNIVSSTKARIGTKIADNSIIIIEIIIRMIITE